MNNTADVRELRDRINSHGQGDELVFWLRREFIKLRLEIAYMDRATAESEILSSILSVLDRIKEENPSDPRAFAEKELNMRRFDRELIELTQDVFLLAPGDQKACDSLEQAVERLVQRAEKEFPGFRERNMDILGSFSNALRSARTQAIRAFAVSTKEEKKPVKEAPRLRASSA
jgi:hypothetical protein